MTTAPLTASVTGAEVGIHQVLIATDLSQYCNLAMSFGLELARAYQSISQVVHVFPVREFVIAGPEAVAAARVATERDLGKLKSDLREHGYIEGEDYQLTLMEGEVAEAILEAARRKQVDLILVATHGRSGLGRALMGSVAEQVFRQSLTPVMTLGPNLHLASASRIPRNILLAADFSPAAARAALYAAWLARQHDARLTVLHVVEPSALAGGADRATVEMGIERKLNRMLEGQAGARSKVRIEAGKTVPTILRVADDINADLLVMGVRPWAGVFDRFMWPHAYEIVREARCPVLTVRGTTGRNQN
ncbi:MAG: universal stress protein [Acidobacteriaceae bacterium]